MITTIGYLQADIESCETISSLVPLSLYSHVAVHSSFLPNYLLTVNAPHQSFDLKLRAQTVMHNTLTFAPSFPIQTAELTMSQANIRQVQNYEVGQHKP